MPESNTLRLQFSTQTTMILCIPVLTLVPPSVCRSTQTKWYLYPGSVALRIQLVKRLPMGWMTGVRFQEQSWLFPSAKQHHSLPSSTRIQYSLLVSTQQDLLPSAESDAAGSSQLLLHPSVLPAEHLSGPEEQQHSENSIRTEWFRNYQL